MKYLISDTHFDHWNIAKYCNRPYSTLDIMNSDMIVKWNDTVKPEDEIFHHGDVGCWFKENAWVTDILPKLNGKKYLIPGNHDKKLIEKLKRYFTVLPPIYELRDKHEDAGDIMIVMCHYPILSWNGMFHGSMHTYGHTHADMHVLPPAAVHVGVDTNNFKPVSTDEIVTIVTQRLIKNE